MKFGLVLPNMGSGSSREGIEAGAETAERLGWEAVWVTDHLLVPGASSAQYGRSFEALETLAYVAARTRRVRLGTSVLVVPQRNAVVLAKELATLDVLSGGRLTVGAGTGWNEAEFSNVGAEDRFHRRGAYLDETLALWRHLWSGSTEPFKGTFHSFHDFAFGPLPIQGEHVPIVIGGGSEAALRRAGSIGDGYQATPVPPAEFARRVAVVKDAAQRSSRPVPAFSVRVRVSAEPIEGWEYSLADIESIRRDLRAYEEIGVEHLAVGFPAAAPEVFVAAVERFDREIARAVVA
jgi:probable F420-dependent oxidoreductase